MSKMKIIKLYFILILSINSFFLWSQGDFLCTPRIIEGEIAKGGAWVSFETRDQKPFHKIRKVTDTSFLLIDTVDAKRPRK
jgi:hypothetical protein